MGASAYGISAAIDERRRNEDARVHKAVGHSAIMRELEWLIASGFGDAPSPAERSEIIGKAAGDPARVASAYKEVMRERGDQRILAGATKTRKGSLDDRTDLPLPGNDPSLAASAASSSGGMPGNLRPSVANVVPQTYAGTVTDVIGILAGGQWSQAIVNADSSISFRLVGEPTVTTDLDALKVSAALAVQAYTVSAADVIKMIGIAAKGGRVDGPNLECAAAMMGIYLPERPLLNAMVGAFSRRAA